MLDIPGPWRPICAAITTSIAVPTSLYILSRESWKRKNTYIMYPSKWMAVFSFLCIAVGPIYPMIYPFMVLYPAATALECCASIMAFSQSLLMQWYQLCRLHYCFSKDKSHSNNGYPKWMFIIMFVASTLSGLSLQASVIVFLYENEDNGTFTSYSEAEGNGFLSMFPAGMIYIFCDILTAFLYWHKIWSIIKQAQYHNSEILRTIHSILYRVLILTIFYWIILTLSTSIDFVFSGFASVGFSLSMYLMQDHNTKEYIYFLRLIRRICCCCGTIIKDQLLMLTTSCEKRIQETITKEQTESQFASVGSRQLQRNQNGMELSVDTKTVISGEMS